MARLRARLARIARTEVTVLLTGETGTGKSTGARVLHAASPRKDAPYVVVNCPGIPESLLESELFGHARGAFTGAIASRPGLLSTADGGTLLLDEIGELPPPQQAKLLTAIEDREVRPVGAERARPVDIRLLAATVRDLRAAVRDGEFRADLFHRVAVLQLHFPPLRERPDDVPLLARHYLRVLARRHRKDPVGLDSEGVEYLKRQPWPGNVRELVHLLEAALVLSDGPRLGAAELREAAPEDPSGDPAARAPRGTDETRHAEPSGRYSFYGDEEEERERIRRALIRECGNRTRAAELLGMSRGTLRHRIRKYGLDTRGSAS